MAQVVIGKVVDAATGKPVAGVRVEAWDKDPGPDDYLGTAETGADGGFTIIFSEAQFQEFFFDRKPDLYFKVFFCGQLLLSTESSVLWNASAATAVELKIPPLPTQGPFVERHIYLKIEAIEGYNPVQPQDKVVPPVQYGRDCMRGHGHESGLIPQAEIDARRLDVVVYREYLDSGYLIPKPDKLILADVNEPVHGHRVPGTVIYTRPRERLKIHVWNTAEEPHSLHVHGLRYGIDSDGSWPFGVESTHGLRSDAICPDATWTYTFEVTDQMYGAWPFHDHTHHHYNAIDRGLFGGIVVLRPCDNPPRRFTFPHKFLESIYGEIARLSNVNLAPALAGVSVGPQHGGPGHDHADLDDDDEGVLQLPRQLHVKRLKRRSSGIPR